MPPQFEYSKQSVYSGTLHFLNLKGVCYKSVSLDKRQTATVIFCCFSTDWLYWFNAYLSRSEPSKWTVEHVLRAKFGESLIRHVRISGSLTLVNMTRANVFMCTCLLLIELPQ